MARLSSVIFCVYISRLALSIFVMLTSLLAVLVRNPVFGKNRGTDLFPGCVVRERGGKDILGERGGGQGM